MIADGLSSFRGRSKRLAQKTGKNDSQEGSLPNLKTPGIGREVLRGSLNSNKDFLHGAALWRQTLREICMALRVFERRTIGC